MKFDIWGIWLTIRGWFLVAVAFIASLFTSSPVLPVVRDSQIMIVNLQPHLTDAPISIFQFRATGNDGKPKLLHVNWTTIPQNSSSDVIDKQDNATKMVMINSYVHDITEKVNGVVASEERNKTKVIVIFGNTRCYDAPLEKELQSNQYVFLKDSFELFRFSITKEYQLIHYTWLALVHDGLAENPQILEQCRLYYIGRGTFGDIDSSNIRPNNPGEPFALSVQEASARPPPGSYYSTDYLQDFKMYIYSLSIDKDGKSACLAPNIIYHVGLPNGTDDSFRAVGKEGGKEGLIQRNECFQYVRMYFESLKMLVPPSKDKLYLMTEYSKDMEPFMLNGNDTDNPLQIKQIREIVEQQCEKINCIDLLVMESILVDCYKLKDTDVVHFRTNYKDNTELWTAGLALAES